MYDVNEEARSRRGRGTLRFVYMSGEGADHNRKRVSLSARVKGKTEKDLIDFCCASPNLQAHIYRPGYSVPSSKYPEDRKHSRSCGNRDGHAHTICTCRLHGRVCQDATLCCVAPSLLTPIKDSARFTVAIAKGRWSDKELFRDKDMIEIVKDL